MKRNNYYSLRGICNTTIFHVALIVPDSFGSKHNRKMHYSYSNELLNYSNLITYPVLSKHTIH